MSLHVSWAGFWWLVVLLGLLTVIVILLVPFRVHQKKQREERLPPDLAGTLELAPAHVKDHSEASRE